MGGFEICAIEVIFISKNYDLPVFIVAIIHVQGNQSKSRSN